MILRAALLCLLATPAMVTPALADLDVRFIEGAPTDRFVFTNTGGCSLGAATLTVDLAGSAAGLIFDTTAAGQGVEVFQPFRLVSGADQVIGAPMVSDGDQQVTLSLRDLPVGQSVAFTIDVDDTLGQRQITVSGSEIAGASVRAQIAGQNNAATFATSARATVQTPPCTS